MELGSELKQAIFQLDTLTKEVRNELEDRKRRHAERTNLLSQAIHTDEPLVMIEPTERKKPSKTTSHFVNNVKNAKNAENEYSTMREQLNSMLTEILMLRRSRESLAERIEIC